MRTRPFHAIKSKIKAQASKISPPAKLSASLPSTSTSPPLPLPPLKRMWKSPENTTISYEKVIPQHQKPLPYFSPTVFKQVQDALLSNDRENLPSRDTARLIKDRGCTPDGLWSKSRPSGKLKHRFKTMMSRHKAQDLMLTEDAYAQVRIPAMRPRWAAEEVEAIVKLKQGQKDVDLKVQHDSTEEDNAPITPAIVKIPAGQRKRFRLGERIKEALYASIQTKFSSHPDLSSVHWSIQRVVLNEALSVATVYWLPLVWSGEDPVRKRNRISESLERHQKVLRWWVTERLPWSRQSARLNFVLDEQTIKMHGLNEVLERVGQQENDKKNYLLKEIPRE